MSHQVASEVAEDESMKDSETDGGEMPLGKIIKRLRAKGAKARREVKNNSVISGEKKGNDLDILKMVRQINSDNLGSSSKFDSSNGHEHTPKQTRVDRKLHKRKELLDESNDVSVPKRRRSSSSLGHKFSPSKITLKRQVPSFESMEMDHGFNTGSEGQVTNEPAESELVVSCIEKSPNFPSNHKGKRSFRVHDKGRDLVAVGNDQKVNLFSNDFHCGMPAQFKKLLI